MFSKHYVIIHHLF